LGYGDPGLRFPLGYQYYAPDGALELGHLLTGFGRIAVCHESAFSLMK
jgi:hypothetical protein